MQNAAFQEKFVEDGPQQVSFSATGGEYFRIWIVHVLLTIVTLGIYSAWAKVRSNQYFYSSTRLAGSSFEYHGNAMAILKGRVIAVLLLLGYQILSHISVSMSLLMLALLLWKSLQFKLYNTSYRGIRFGFDGNASEAYTHFLLLPLLTITVVLTPFAHQRLKRWQHRRSRFGTSSFRFEAPVGKFYLVYAIMVGVALAAIVGLGLLAFAAQTSAQNLVWFALLFYVVMAALSPLFFTMIQNVIWNHTGLREHEFRCDMKWGGLLWIYFTNMLGIIVTLGLFTPFAKVRAMKYRLESMSMIVNGSLDGFVAAEQEQIGATGEGVADFADFDLSL